MKKILMSAGVVLLAGCNGGGGDVSLQPGQWETTMRMTEVNAPGMPEEAVTQMRSQLNQTQTQSDCMTAEEAANPAANIANAGGGANGCDFSESTFEGGEIEVRGSCPGPGGPNTMRMTMEGSYTATTMEGTITTEMDMPAGMPGANGASGPIRVSGTFAGRRTGECSGS